MLDIIKDLKEKAKTKEDRNEVVEQITQFQKRLTDIIWPTVEVSSTHSARRMALIHEVEEELADILVDIKNTDIYEELLKEKELEKKNNWTCWSPCLVYSRVVGYYSPLNQRNKWKQEEFGLRKTFKIKED